MLTIETATQTDACNTHFRVTATRTCAHNDRKFARSLRFVLLRCFVSFVDPTKQVVNGKTTSPQQAMPARNQHEEKRCHARTCRESKLRQPHTHMSCSKGSKVQQLSTNSPSTLGSLCTFMCVHTFRSWAIELSITRLGPIPKLGPTGARNFLITSLPLATCNSMLNSHTKSIHYVHTYFRTSALVLCSLRLQPLAASSNGRLLEAFGLDSYR